ncbi:MAG: tetratricopeptide repeat protein [Candidatus Obscuribacterales bacterium]
MKQRISMLKKKALIASSLSLLMTSVGVGLFSPAFAIDNLDDVGLFGSITVTRQARDAARAVKQSQWTAAMQSYQKALSLDPKATDLYYGLYNAAAHVGDWQQVSLALEQIFQADPSAKAHLLAEYGQCLASSGRLEEAIPVLKKALITVDADANYMPDKLRALMVKTETVKEVPKRELTQAEKDRMVAEVTKYKPPTRDLVHGEDVRGDKSDFALTLENAYTACEFIGICTYEGVNKADIVTYYHPPVARFHIDTILRGPKLNREMPVRYEFHDKTGDEPPKDWKYSEDKLPKKGSKWILFTDLAIPTNGAFETYHGNFGRLEATDANLDKIYKIIELHRGQQ